MAEINFVVGQEALAVVQKTSITANFQECENALNAMLEPYKHMVVQEGDLPQAKADRARIRKVAQRIDDARKQVKRVYTAPLADFEQKCKRLTAICDEADNNIATQLNAFDEKRREEKLDGLRQFFNANVGEAKDYLSFSAITNPKWGNVTYTEEQAHSDILREISSCVASVGAIKTLKSPFETVLLDTYRQTRDLALCMTKHEAWLKQQEMEAKRKAEQEELARQAEEQAHPDVADADDETEDTTQEESAEPVSVIDFRVFVTRPQMEALRDFLKKNGIRYAPVPKV